MARNFTINGTGHPGAQLEVNGLNVVFNTPPAAKSIQKDGDEWLQELPGYAPRTPFLVDHYPLCPENWMRSSGRTKSFFLPVREGDGLWLDFNGNNQHPNHLAVVISVQGVNAITGRSCEDPHLEQYLDKCPKHNVDFGPDRYCAKCEFNWPKQNYIASTGTPYGSFWIDGWRIGKAIRQFIITADKMRGVAKHVLGEDRVYAIGLSFFLSKQPRLAEPNISIGGHGWDQFMPAGATFTPGGYYNINAPDLIQGQLVKHVWHHAVLVDDTGGYTDNDTVSYAGNDTGNYTRCACAVDSKAAASVIAKQGAAPHAFQYVAAVPTPIQAKAEVGAGARIDQLVHPDPCGLDYWQEQPEGIIVVNYVFENQCQKIIEGGKILAPVKHEGFLQGIPVGN